MCTNVGRSMIINEHNKWYRFAYAIDVCGIDCDDKHEASENLKKFIKSLYSVGYAIDTCNFGYMSAYDGLDACSLLDAINSNEIRQGVTQGDLSTMYFVYNTDAIKGGEN